MIPLGVEKPFQFPGFMLQCPGADDAMSKTQTKPRTVCFFARSSTEVPGTQRIRSKSLCRMFRLSGFWHAPSRSALEGRDQMLCRLPTASASPRGWNDPVYCMCIPGQLLSRVQLFATPWTVAHQASLSMGFSRQEYWSGLPFPSPRDLPNPGIKPMSPVSPALTGGFLCISFLKINSYLLEAGRHLVKITVSGKASPSCSPPLTPTLFFLKSSCGF